MELQACGSGQTGSADLQSLSDERSMRIGADAGFEDLVYQGSEEISNGESWGFEEVALWRIEERGTADGLAEQQEAAEVPGGEAGGRGRLCSDLVGICFDELRNAAVWMSWGRGWGRRRSSVVVVGRLGGGCVTHGRAPSVHRRAAQPDQGAWDGGALGERE